MIRPLPNPCCYREILRRIRGARRSIVIVNYLAEILHRKTAKGRIPVADDAVLEIARVLKAAGRRGVKISAILEGSRLSDNYDFYRALKDNKLDCWLDTSMTLVHQKAILVDDRVLITGSHNWSDAAFERNEEFSVLTNDRKTIARFKRELGRITKQREELRGLKSDDVLALPWSFLEKVSRPLYRVHADHAFNLYMILCFEDGGRPRPIPIDAKKWCGMLGLDPKTAGKGVDENYRRYYHSQRLNRVLGQLKKNFGLIEVDRKSDTVRRLPLPAGDRKISLPRSLVSFGWLTRLTIAAKHFHVISLMETTDSPFYPWWSRSLSGLKEKYGCSAASIRLGFKQLEEYNILELLRSIPVKRGRFYSEEAHFYRINPIYDMKRFERGLKKLEKSYSKGTVDVSRKVAQTFRATHNLDTIENIAMLIRRHGRKKVRAAGNKILKLSAASSRFCFNYLEELVVNR